MDKEILTTTPDNTMPTDEQKKRIVGWITKKREKSEKGKKKYMTAGEYAEAGYLGVQKRANTTNNIQYEREYSLPWFKDAVDSLVAHLAPTLYPRGENFFAIEGRNYSDELDSELLERYTGYCFDRDGFYKKAKKWVKELALKGSGGYKIKWKTEYKQVIGESEPRLVFHQPSVDAIDPKDFFPYPLSGEFEKAVKIHRTYHSIVGLEKLLNCQDEGYFQDPDFKEWLADQKRKPKEDKYVADEAWIPELVLTDGVSFENKVALVIENKWLVRWVDNNLPYNSSPFVWTALSAINGEFFGYPLTSSVHDLWLLSCDNVNDAMQQQALNISPPNGYIPTDAMFDPQNIISTPGALVPMGSPQTVFRLQMTEGDVQGAFNAVSFAKSEFESVTVPKAVKGIIEENNRTATEINTVHNSANSKMDLMAGDINDDINVPLVEMFYNMIHQEAVREQNEPFQPLLESIIQVTQEKPTPNDPTLVSVPNENEGMEQQQAPTEVDPKQKVLTALRPSLELNIKAVGYENFKKKQDSLQGLKTASEILAPFGEAALSLFSVKRTAKGVLHSVNLDTDQWFKSDEEAEEEAKAQQSHQEQAQQVEQKQMQLQDAEVALKQADARLKEFDAQLKAQQQQHDQQMEVLDKQIKLKELEIKQIELEETLTNGEHQRGINERMAKNPEKQTVVGIDKTTPTSKGGASNQSSDDTDD